MPDPFVLRLLNDRDDNNAIICPDCRKPIALNIGAKFREGYALHIVCTPCPHHTSESG